MIALGEPLDSHAASRVENSQPAGIGRVVAVGEGAAWNNLGRNVVFADRRLRPRAVFDETLYPGDDEPSQYDLDVHAVVEVPGADLVLVLNHVGTLRSFPASAIPARGPVRRLSPMWTADFAEDVERSVVVGPRLVGSRPRSDGASGLVVSDPLDRPPAGERITVRGELEDWGEVTALAASPDLDDGVVAVGGVGRVSLVPLVDGTAGRARWDVEVGFRAAVLAWDGGVLWAAGSELTLGIDDYDWEQVRGGGLVAIDPADGRVLDSAPLPDDVAWGNGGVAFVVVGGRPCAIGRTGALYVRSGPGDATWRRSAPVGADSLGIAHAAVVGDQLVYGFNRGGYRLRAVAGHALAQLAGSGT